VCGEGGFGSERKKGWVCCKGGGGGGWTVKGAWRGLMSGCWVWRGGGDRGGKRAFFFSSKSSKGKKGGVFCEEKARWRQAVAFQAKRDRGHHDKSVKGVEKQKSCSRRVIRSRKKLGGRGRLGEGKKNKIGKAPGKNKGGRGEFEVTGKRGMFSIKKNTRGGTGGGER